MSGPPRSPPRRRGRVENPDKREPRKPVMLPSMVPCVLKGNLPGNEVSIMRCVQTNNEIPGECAKHGCRNHMGATMALRLDGTGIPMGALAEVV